MKDDDRVVYLGTDSGATTSKVGAVWGDGTIVSTKLLQRPTNSQEGPEAVVRSWVDAACDFLEQHGLGWDQVRGAWAGDPRTVPALRGARQVAQPAGELRRVRRPQRLRQRPRRARGPADPARRRQRRQPRGRGRGPARPGQRPRHRAHARAGLGPRLRLRRRPRPGSRRRYPRGHGGRPHPAAAAPAGCQALSLRLRPDLGLRRGLHDPLRPPLPAGRTPGEGPRPRACEVRQAHERARLRTPRPRPEGGPAGARHLRLPGTRPGDPRRGHGDGARSRSSSSSAAA